MMANGISSAVTAAARAAAAAAERTRALGAQIRTDPAVAAAAAAAAQAKRDAEFKFVGGLFRTAVEGGTAIGGKLINADASKTAAQYYADATGQNVQHQPASGRGPGLVTIATVGVVGAGVVYVLTRRR